MGGRDSTAGSLPRGRWEAPMCSGGPGALLLMMDICTLVAMIWCKLLGCPCRGQEQNKSAALTTINGHRITTSQPQRQKRDFGEIIGVPRLHALKAEWRKRQVFVQDKVTEPADTGRCKHFSVSLVRFYGWYLGDSHPVATHKPPQSWPF